MTDELDMDDISYDVSPPPPSVLKVFVLYRIIIIELFMVICTLFFLSKTFGWP